jgi:hypothetical protein
MQCIRDAVEETRSRHADIFVGMARGADVAHQERSCWSEGCGDAGEHGGRREPSSVIGRLTDSGFGPSRCGPVTAASGTAGDIHCSGGGRTPDSSDNRLLSPDPPVRRPGSPLPPRSPATAELYPSRRPAQTEPGIGFSKRRSPVEPRLAHRDPGSACVQHTGCGTPNVSLSLRVQLLRNREQWTVPVGVLLPDQL